MKLASFDIFDTTLIRKCGKPENIFYLLAHRIYPNDEAKREDFLLWRKKAEGAARRLAPGKEVTIDDIYSLESAKSFGEYGKKELIEAEMSVEAEQLIANPEVREVINRKREEGFAICFISDMYMPGAFLKRVLEREGCIRKDEEVYVSCEWNARKSNGALYRKLREVLKPVKWMHFGDHPVSDVKMARKNGVKGIKVDTDFSVPESKLMQKGPRCITNEISCLVGLQRAARIHSGNDKYNNIAADFVAPAYIPYVYWIIEKCKVNGIKRLYFLSRDSYILQRIAEELPHEGIELRYLFVSRKSLLLPYMQSATAAKFMAVQDKNTIIGKNVDALLKSLGTSKDELSSKYGITFDFDKIRNKNEERLFLNTILESDYLPTLDERAKEERKLLNGYLNQEGVFSEEKTAMVDVGWLGTTRLMINSILNEEGYNETVFFYYGVRNDILGCKHGKYLTYHNPVTSNTDLTFIVEDYFSNSPYKTTTGYSFIGDKYEANLACKTEYNKIVSSNTHVCKWVAKELDNYPGKVLQVLDFWEETAMDCNKNSIHQIDNTPFIECGISRKLNIVEFCNIVFMGGHKTLFDKASIALSSPKFIFPVLWKIHLKSARVRAFLARKLRK